MNTTAKRAPLGSPVRHWLAALTRALAWSLGLGLIASLVATAAALASPDPNALIAPLSCAITAICSLVGGFVTRRRTRHSPLLCGAIAGAMLVALFGLLGAILPTTHAWPASVAWGLRGGMLAFALLGASLGSNLPKKCRRKTSGGRRRA